MTKAGKLRRTGAKPPYQYSLKGNGRAADTWPLAPAPVNVKADVTVGDRLATEQTPVIRVQLDRTTGRALLEIKGHFILDVQT